MSIAAQLVTMLGLLGAIGALLGGLRYCQAKYRPDPEVVRKLFHIGGGVIGLTLPWLFDDVLPVLVLGVLLCAMFVAIRVMPRLRDGVGGVLFGVERSSFGEFAFLVSMGLLFWLSRGDKLLYVIPIMMVALADAAAALVGRTYGKFQLHMSGDRKSIEGALTFFLVAFLCVHVPVLLSGQTGRAESLLIGVNVSAMVMLAEAAAWRGLDNLIIPLWGYMVLKSLLEAGNAELVGDLTFLLTLSTFMYFWRSRTTLGDDAIAGTVLYGYVVWSVGGVVWILTPLLLFATYATLTARVPLDSVRNLRFPVALALVAGSVPWLLAFRQTADRDLLVPFAAFFGAHVAMIALARARYAEPSLPLRRAVFTSSIIGILIVLPAMFAIYGAGAMSAVGAGAGLVAIVGATVLFHRLQPRLSEMPVDYGRWLRQAVIGTASSLVAYGLQGAALWTLLVWGEP